MTLDLSREETTILLWALIKTNAQSPATETLMDKLYVARGTLHLPLEPHGSKEPNLPSPQAGNDEQLRSGVSDRRPQSDNQPQRAPQIQPSDRWAKKYQPDGKGSTVLNVTPAKIEKKATSKGDPMLVVSYENPAGRGFANASVFDEELFSWVSSRIKQPTTFYVTKNGKYTNIVGVRA